MSMTRFDRGTFHPMAAALAAQKGRSDYLATLVAVGGDETGLTDTLRSDSFAHAQDPDPDAGRAPSADPVGLGSHSALD